MRVRCTDGTYLEKMNEAIRFAEDKRKYVVNLSNEIGDIAKIELANRMAARGRKGPIAQSALDTVADERVGGDPRWKLAVQDEQWGWRLTTMYALADLAATQRFGNQVRERLLAVQRSANALAERQLHEIQISNELGRQLLSEQRTTNELLRMLVVQQTVPLPSVDQSAPQPRRPTSIEGDTQDSDT